MASTEVLSALGQTDIYLLDQIMRGRIVRDDVIFDAGCGHGRNLTFFLSQGFTVHAVDADPDAVAAARRLAREVGVELPPERIRVEPLEEASFADEFADVVVSSAVLHFARDDDQFERMLNASWRALRSGGMFFARLASSIGIADRVLPVSGRVHRLPDGTTRYLVDERCLLEHTRRLGGRLLDPVKTTVVQDQRAMTTWVVRKN